MKKRVLILGSGGREHALGWKLAQEAEVIVAPGNPGIGQTLAIAQVNLSDLKSILLVAKEVRPDLIVIGPEAPLILGAADVLREAGFLVFGPGSRAAELEGSKAFSKEMMARAGVPTAVFGIFRDSAEAKEYAKSQFEQGKMVAVKASGEALGKGVVVCDSFEMAEDAIEMMLDEGSLGVAGSTIVIETRLLGPEFSLLTLVSEQEILSLPVARDHKRALDKDRGPNTGGMGTFSPVESISEDMVKLAEDTIVRPILAQLAKEGISYRGVLFSGLMMDAGEIFCLEYNVRFGDPETQSLMLRLGEGLYDALEACANGQQIPAISLLDNHAVCVVLASGGYPGEFRKGFAIKTPDSLEPGQHIFYAGVSGNPQALITSGGRVLGACAVANTLVSARQKAYDLAEKIEFESKMMRTDIAAKL